MKSHYTEPIARLREASRPDRPAAPALAGYLENVRLHAYKVTDRDIEELKEEGFSEDEIFEQTVSAAAAAGFERLEAALAVMR